MTFLCAVHCEVLKDLILVKGSVQKVFNSDNVIGYKKLRFLKSLNCALIEAVCWKVLTTVSSFIIHKPASREFYFYGI